MNSLLGEYRRHACDQGASMLEGEGDASNEAYDRLQDAFMSLIRAGRRDELFELYNDFDPWVQSWAAAHTLEIDEARALAKLEHLQNSENPHVSSCAKIAIEEWKNGALRFSPE